MERKHISSNGNWQFEVGDVNDNFVELFDRIDSDGTYFKQAARKCLMPVPAITAPTADATDVSVTPTIVTAKGATAEEIAASYIDYTFVATQVQIRVHNTTANVYESDDVENLSVTVSPALENSTEYDVRVRHKHSEGFYTLWSAWQSFTTVAAE